MMEQQIDAAFFERPDTLGIDCAEAGTLLIECTAEKALDDRARCVRHAANDSERAIAALQPDEAFRLLLGEVDGGHAKSLGPKFCSTTGASGAEHDAEDKDMQEGAADSATWLVVPGEESLAGNSDAAGDWVTDALTETLPEPRWTYNGIRAYHYLRTRRSEILRARLRVFSLDWEAGSGTSESEKNFPFFVKSLEVLQEENASALNEEREVFRRTSPDQSFSVPLPQLVSLPSWGRLPKVTERSAELQEVVAGARFASIANPDASLTSWFFSAPADDECCLSIELPEAAAKRFLAGERGSVGGSLHRGFKRRLERLLGPLALGVVWVRGSACPDGLTIFMMIRTERTTQERSVEDLRRSRRFYESLLKHGVELPEGIPIETIGRHLSSYLGMSEDELAPRDIPVASDHYLLDSYRDDDPRVAGIVDYTPERGLATDQELEAHAKRSNEWWLERSRRYGFPTWFDARFVKFLHDYFMFTPEHVRERQKLKDTLTHRQKMTTPAERKSLKARLRLLLGRELVSPTAINYFRASPACFAALASRSGEIVGEYCDSKNKAGKAKKLYEELRKELAA